MQTTLSRRKIMIDKSRKTLLEKSRKADGRLKQRLERFNKRAAKKKVTRKKNAVEAGKKKLKA